MGKYTPCILFLLISASTVWCSCGNQGYREGKDVARACYWDHYHFADTTIDRQARDTEQQFADFCVALSGMDERMRTAEVDSLLVRAMRGGRRVFERFVELSELYLHEPDSPYRHEELYILFLQHILSLETIEEAYKLRFEFQLRTAMKNRKGTKAADFRFVTAKGVNGSLSGIKSKYILLCFYNPGCQACVTTKRYIIESDVISQLRTDGELTVLALYPDEDIEAWERHTGENPPEWITARYADASDREAYDLPAIPNLYLLDADKKVLLKDAPVELVELWFSRLKNK